jgi:hypothetical protein
MKMTKVSEKENAPRGPKKRPQKATWATTPFKSEHVCKGCHKKEAISISGLVFRLKSYALDG